MWCWSKEEIIEIVWWVAIESSGKLSGGKMRTIRGEQPGRARLSKLLQAVPPRSPTPPLTASRWTTDILISALESRSHALPSLTSTNYYSNFADEMGKGDFRWSTGFVWKNNDYARISADHTFDDVFISVGTHMSNAEKVKTKMYISLIIRDYTVFFSPFF